MIEGFDEQGFPVIKDKTVKNSTVDGKIPEKGETILYPEPDMPKLPFIDESHDIWSDEFTNPYSYPDIKALDFPDKPKREFRYDVPGRNHFSNNYPFEMFNYTDPVMGKHRKHLPLPKDLKVPKTKKSHDQLVYENGKIPMDLDEALETVYGINFPKERTDKAVVFDPHKATDEPIESAGLVPPLLIPISQSGDMSRPSRPTTATPKRTRSIDESQKISPRPMNEVAQMPGNTKFKRAKSAASPRSILTGSTTPRPDTAKPSVGFKEAHAIKPPRIFLPPMTPETPKSAMRRDSSRPMTAGRKSVTIQEDGLISRPSTTMSSTRPSTASRRSPFFAPRSTSEFDNVRPISGLERMRPMSSIELTRQRLGTPQSARPRSDQLLPSELTSAYRPASSGVRPMTPAEHPKPYYHPGVTVTKTSNFSQSLPHPLRGSATPSEHKMKFVPPPPMPFFGNKKPKKEEIASMVTKSGRHLTLHIDDSEDDDFETPLFDVGKKKPKRNFKKIINEKLPFLSMTGRSASRNRVQSSASLFGNGHTFPEENPRALSRVNSVSSSIRVPSILTKNCISPE